MTAQTHNQPISRISNPLLNERTKMAKTPGKTLTQNSEGYKAVSDKVNVLWERHGEKIECYPTPSALYEELEAEMTPYGDNRDKRLAKLRGCYNKLISKKFIANGKYLSFIFFVICSFVMA